MQLNLGNNKIIPVVVLNTVEDTVPTLSALKDGGITVAEITFRTACAAQAIQLACGTFPDMLIGAGTVINGAQCKAAIGAGARFIVSPGFSEEVCRVCEAEGVPYLPGAVTATEVMNLIAHGITTIKFFPAETSGGLAAMKALAAAFPGIDFMPTGGIGPKNMKEYLNAPFVRAIGGSWMLKGTPAEITAMARAAVEEAER